MDRMEVQGDKYTGKKFAAFASLEEKSEKIEEINDIAPIFSIARRSFFRLRDLQCVMNQEVSDPIIGSLKCRPDRDRKYTVGKNYFLAN